LVDNIKKGDSAWEIKGVTIPFGLLLQGDRYVLPVSPESIHLPFIKKIGERLCQDALLKKLPNPSSHAKPLFIVCVVVPEQQKSICHSMELQSRYNLLVRPEFRPDGTLELNLARLLPVPDQPETCLLDVSRTGNCTRRDIPFGRKLRARD